MPYRLDTLQEATFNGYAPAAFVAAVRSGYDSGFAYVDGSATFWNKSDTDTEHVVGGWLTAPFNGVQQLLSVIAAFPGGLVALPPGPTTLETRWTSYEIK
jgi:hypothetical protein